MFKFSKHQAINFAKLHRMGEDIYNNLPLVKKYRRKRRLYKIIKYFCYGAIGLLLLILIFFSSYFLLLKQIYSQALDGKRNLEQTAYFINNDDFKQATIMAKIADNDFITAVGKLGELNNSFLAKRWSYLKNQLNNVNYLLVSAEFLSRAVYNGADYGLKLENALGRNSKFSYSQFTPAEKKLVLKYIYEAGPELAGMKANLDLALISLGQVKTDGLLLPLSSKINQFKDQLAQGGELLDKALPLSQIAPMLAGYPIKADFLFVMQNSDELRPTGGFIGTYGIVSAKDGEITRFDTHDIYHLDMPVKDRISVTPPNELIKYLGVNKWYMRDANWSPDWPTSAAKIAWFYENENRLLKNPDPIKKFNGIIGVTPKLITDLLNITGPITIDNVVYTKDNFIKLLEYKVEKGYVQLGVSSWQRKEVIGDIAKRLVTILLDLPKERWQEIINLISDNLNQKNLLLYFTDIQAENLLKEKNSSGELRNFDGDYFMAVDANMAALKTDAVINRNINYNLKQNKNDLTAELTINYSHNGDFDWRTTRYRTYTRIYVPLGSQLIRAEGLEAGSLKVVNELGKTSFGGFIVIEPGKIGSLYFQYRLPQEIYKSIESGQYLLLAQKQPGSIVNSLKVDLNFLNTVKSYDPMGFNVLRQNNQISWQADFNTDKEYSASF